MSYYAIETIGYGAKRRYLIKEVFDTITCPVDRKPYRTEEAAREAARRMGIEIGKIGDAYQIIRIYDEHKRVIHLQPCTCSKEQAEKKAASDCEWLNGASWEVSTHVKPF